MSQNRVSCPARKSPQKKILKKGFFICLFIDEGKSILVSCLHGPELVSFLLLLFVLIALLSPLKSTRKQQSEKGERLTDSKLKVREEGEDGRCGEDTPANKDALLVWSLQTANSEALGGVAQSFHE